MAKSDEPASATGIALVRCTNCGEPGTDRRHLLRQPDGSWLHRECGGLVPDSAEWHRRRAELKGAAA